MSLLMETLKDAYQHIQNQYTNLILLAIKEGNLDFLKWTRDQSSWNETILADAAKQGSLSIVKWLREHGCPWNSGACAWAASTGQLQILQWLRENGCPWNEWTCTHAAQGGHLHVLKWAVENGCPLTLETFKPLTFKLFSLNPEAESNRLSVPLSGLSCRIYFGIFLLPTANFFYCP